MARRTQQVRVNAKSKKSEIENKYNKINNYKKRIDDLTLTLEEIESQKLNVEERTKRLEKMVEVRTLRHVYIFYLRRIDFKSLTEKTIFSKRYRVVLTGINVTIITYYEFLPLFSKTKNRSL